MRTERCSVCREDMLFNIIPIMSPASKTVKAQADNHSSVWREKCSREKGHPKRQRSQFFKIDSSPAKHPGKPSRVDRCVSISLDNEGRYLTDNSEAPTDQLYTFMCVCICMYSVCMYIMYSVCVCMCAVAGIEPRALCSLSKCSTVEIQPQPSFSFALVGPGPTNLPRLA